MKLSIIVPVYNVAPYLKQCLESIANQTYRDFECVIVDDGSTDNSGEICADFAFHDSRFHIITQENKGLSLARIVAFRETKGEYIGFVDADDYISSDMFALLMETAINNAADIVICAWWRVMGECLKGENLYSSDAKLPKELAMRDLAKDHIRSYMWNKLFKRNLLQNTLFITKTKIMEDYACMHHIFSKAENIYYLAKNLYYYRYRPESIMGSAKLVQRVEGYIIAKERCEFYRCNYPQMRRDGKIGLFNHAWVLCKNYACPQEQEARAIYLDADSFIKVFFKEYMANKPMGKKERLSLWLYAHFTKGVRIWKAVKNRKKYAG